MKFDEVLQLMKSGERVKLPTWGGYWLWDEENNTIQMFLKEGLVMDIRQAEDLDYTIKNILSDEWMVATEWNTPLLGGTLLFGFAEAVKHILKGNRVTRTVWEEGEYVCLLPSSSCTWMGEVPMKDCIGFMTTLEEMQPGWVPSTLDIMAEDWMFVEGK